LKIYNYMINYFYYYPQLNQSSFSFYLFKSHIFSQYLNFISFADLIHWTY